MGLLILADAPITDYTIGIDSIDKMLDKIDKNPSPIYKIKLGTPQDIEIIKAIRKKTDAKIRVDANAGWSLEDALQLIKDLAEFDIRIYRAAIT